MAASNGIRRDSPHGHRSVRLHPSGDRVSDFDAALYRVEKLLGLNEWRLALLLEGLEALNADMDRAAREVGR